MGRRRHLARPATWLERIRSKRVVENGEPFGRVAVARYDRRFELKITAS